MPAPTCQACGSDQVHRVHARTPWQRLVRGLTPLRRYGCEACGHRGWTSGHLAHRDRARPAPGAVAVVRSARPPEARDLRARWRSRTRLALTVLAALLLGAIAAGRLVSCQNQPFQQAPE